MKNKKIKIELTSEELQAIIDSFNAWDSFDNLWLKERELLKRLIKIQKEESYGK